MFVSWCQEYTLEAQRFPAESDFYAALLGEIGKYANDREWQNHHPAIYWSYTQKSSTAWRECDTDKFDRAVKSLYAEAKRRVMSGEVFTVYEPKQLENVIEIVSSPETAEKALTEIRSILRD